MRGWWSVVGLAVALTIDGGAATAATQPDMTKAVCAKARDLSAYKNKSLALLVPGGDGFLFRTRIDMREYKPLKSGPQQELFQFVAALRKLGTEVVLVVPPPRPVADEGALLPKEVGALGYDVRTAEAGYEAMLDGLRAGGVHVADVLGKARATPLAGGNFYLRRDIHWSSDGARLSAEAAADLIKALPAAAGLEKTMFETAADRTGDADEKLAEALEKICRNDIPHEQETYFKTTEADAEAGLFEERPFDVVLVGTSFSNRGEDDPNFAGFLQQALSTRVYNASEEGGGLEGSMASYLKSDAFRERRPKVIVWEFPPYERPDVDDGEPIHIVRAALEQALSGK
jgi:alginate biosynthesis protein AlgX